MLGRQNDDLKLQWINKANDLLDKLYAAKEAVIKYLEIIDQNKPGSYNKRDKPISFVEWSNFDMSRLVRLGSLESLLRDPAMAGVGSKVSTYQELLMIYEAATCIHLKLTELNRRNQECSDDFRRLYCDLIKSGIYPPESDSIHSVMTSEVGRRKLENQAMRPNVMLAAVRDATEDATTMDSDYRDTDFLSTIPQVEQIQGLIEDMLGRDQVKGKEINALFMLREQAHSFQLSLSRYDELCSLCNSIRWVTDFSKRLDINEKSLNSKCLKLKNAILQISSQGTMEEYSEWLQSCKGFTFSLPPVSEVVNTAKAIYWNQDTESTLESKDLTLATVSKMLENTPMFGDIVPTHYQLARNLMAKGEAWQKRAQDVRHKLNLVAADKIQFELSQLDILDSQLALLLEQQEEEKGLLRLNDLRDEANDLRNQEIIINIARLLMKVRIINDSKSGKLDFNAFSELRETLKKPSFEALKKQPLIQRFDLFVESIRESEEALKEVIVNLDKKKPLKIVIFYDPEMMNVMRNFISLDSIRERINKLEKYFFLGKFGSEVKTYMKKYLKAEQALLDLAKSHSMTLLKDYNYDQTCAVIKEFDGLKEGLELKVQSSSLEDLAAYEWSLHAAKLAKSPKVRLEDIDKHASRVAHLQQTGIDFIDELRDKKKKAIDLRQSIEEALRLKTLSVEELHSLKDSLLKSEFDFPGLLRKMDVKINDHDFVNEYMREIEFKLNAKQEVKRPSLAELEHLLVYIRAYHLSIPIVETKIVSLIDQCRGFCIVFRDFIANTSLKVNRDIKPLIQQYKNLGIIIREIELALKRREDSLGRLKEVTANDVHSKSLKQLGELEVLLRDSLDIERNAELFDTVVTCKAKQLSLLVGSSERSKFPDCTIKREDFFALLSKLPLAIEHNPQAYQKEVNNLLIAKEKIQKYVKEVASDPQKYSSGLLYNFLEISVDQKKQVEDPIDPKVTQVFNRPDPKQPGIQDVTLEGGYNSKEQFNTLRKETKKKLKNILSAEMKLERRSEINYYTQQIDEIAAGRSAKNLLLYTELVDTYIKFVRFFKDNIYLCNLVIQKGCDKVLLGLIMDSYGKYAAEGFSEFEARTCLMAVQLDYEAHRSKYFPLAMHIGEKLEFPTLTYIVKEVKKKPVQEKGWTYSSPTENRSIELNDIVNRMGVLRDPKVQAISRNLLSSPDKKTKNTQTSIEEPWAEHSSTEKRRPQLEKQGAKRTGRSIQASGKKTSRNKSSKKAFRSDKKTSTGDGSNRRYSETGADSSTKVQSMKQEQVDKDGRAPADVNQSENIAKIDEKTADKKIHDKTAENVDFEQTDEYLVHDESGVFVEEGTDEPFKKEDSPKMDICRIAIEDSGQVVKTTGKNEHEMTAANEPADSENQGEEEQVQQDEQTKSNKKTRSKKKTKKAQMKAVRATKVSQMKATRNEDSGSDQSKAELHNNRLKSSPIQLQESSNHATPNPKDHSILAEIPQETSLLQTNATVKHQPSIDSIAAKISDIDDHRHAVKLECADRDAVDAGRRQHRPSTDRCVVRKSSESKIIIPQVNRPLLAGFNKCLPFTPVTKSDDHARLMSQFKREVTGIDVMVDDRSDAGDVVAEQRKLTTKEHAKKKGRGRGKKTGVQMSNKGTALADIKEGKDRQFEKTGKVGEQKVNAKGKTNTAAPDINAAAVEKSDDARQDEGIIPQKFRVTRSRANMLAIEASQAASSQKSVKDPERHYTLRGGPATKVQPIQSNTKKDSVLEKPINFLGKRKVDLSTILPKSSTKLKEKETTLADEKKDEKPFSQSVSMNALDQTSLRERILLRKLKGRPTQRRIPAVLEAAARSKLDEYSTMIQEELPPAKTTKTKTKKKIEKVIAAAEEDAQSSKGMKRLNTGTPQEKKVNNDEEPQSNLLEVRNGSQLAQNQVENEPTRENENQTPIPKAQSEEPAKSQESEKNKPKLVAPPRRPPIKRVITRREPNTPLKVVCAPNNHIYVPRNMVHGESSQSSDTEHISDGEDEVFRNIVTFEDFKAMKLRLKREKSRKETKQHKSLLGLSKVISQKEDSKETEACTQKATPREERMITVRENQPSPPKSEQIEQVPKPEIKSKSVGFWMIYQNKIDFAIGEPRRGDFKLVSLTEVAKIQEIYDFTADRIYIDQVMPNSELEKIVNEQAPSVAKRKSQWIQGFLYSVGDQKIVSELLEGQDGGQGKVFWGRLTPRMRIFFFRPEDISTNLVQIMTRLKDAEPYTSGLSFLIIEEQMEGKNKEALQPLVFEERMKEEQAQSTSKLSRRNSDPDRPVRSIMEAQAARQQARKDRPLNDDLLNFEQHTRKGSTYEAEMDLDNVLEKNYEQARYQHSKAARHPRDRSRSREKRERDVGMDSISSIISR